MAEEMRDVNNDIFFFKKNGMPCSKVININHIYTCADYEDEDGGADDDDPEDGSDDAAGDVVEDGSGCFSSGGAKTPSLSSSSAS